MGTGTHHTHYICCGYVQTESSKLPNHFCGVSGNTRAEHRPSMSGDIWRAGGDHTGSYIAGDCERRLGTSNSTGSQRGLSALATNLSLQPVAPMLWINNAAAPVTITDITFDASNVGSLSAILAGIFVQSSSATISRVGIRNLKVVQPFADMGIYVEGAASNPAVTVQNSSIHDIRTFGIYGETLSGGAGSVSMTLKGNYVSGTNEGILLDSGSAGTVSGNTVSGGNIGISANSGAAVSISGNTVVASGYGVAASDGSTVNGNKIFGTLTAGILIVGQTVAVQTNAITGGPVGIDFECGNDPNVNSNTINEVTTGLDNVPGGAFGTNTYFNVGTLRSAGVCAAPR